MTRPPFPALPGLLEEYRSLHVGSSYDATGREMRIGHLRLNFRSGALHSILTKSGKEAGFVYEGGEGHYSYTTEDPGDLQSIGKNILKFVNTVAYRDGTLSEDMKGCIFVSTAPLLPGILGADAAPKGPAPASAASALTSFLADIDNADIGLDHLGALAALDGTGEPMLYGEIDGQVVDPGYSYDSSVDRRERLFLFRTVQGDRFASTVSRQTVGDGWEKSPIVLTRLDYSLDTDNNHDATVKIVETYTVTVPVGRLLPFYQINHADSAANNWKATRRHVEVRSVKTSDGRELPFSHRYHELLVELPDPPATGASVTLQLDVSLHFLDTRGDQYYYVERGEGFPVPAWQNSVRATSHWKVKTKKPYRTYTGGTIVSRREDGDAMLLESEVDTPSDEPLLIAGKFTTKETERNGLKVRVSIYGSGGSRALDSYTENAFTLLDVLGKTLSPYPRKELDILEFKKIGYDRSTPGLVICTTESAADSVVETRREDWALRAFMHELSHQWFGNLVKPRDYAEDRWIAESVAEYLSAAVYAAGDSDPKGQAKKMQDALKGWWRDADMSKDSVSISQASHLRGGWTEGEFGRELLYGKGPLVLHMLRSILGSDKFFDLLQNVATRYANKEIDTGDFAKEATALAGQDMTWFFRQWIEEPGIPDLEVSKSIVQEGGKTWLTGRLRQHDPKRFKMLVVPFVYEAAGGRAVKLVLMDKPEQDFKVELPAGVSNVTVDPARNNLVYYH